MLFNKLRYLIGFQKTPFRILLSDTRGLAQKLLGILSAKCPVFMGLLRADYAKLFLYDPLERVSLKLDLVALGGHVIIIHGFKVVFMFCFFLGQNCKNVDLFGIFSGLGQFFV